MEYFRDVFQELQRASREMLTASELMNQAHQAMQRAGDHMLKATETAILASEEHDDLRETVNRLEATVMDLVREVRELRNGRS